MLPARMGETMAEKPEGRGAWRDPWAEAQAEAAKPATTYTGPLPDSIVRPRTMVLCGSLLYAGSVAVALGLGYLLQERGLRGGLRAFAELSFILVPLAGLLGAAQAYGDYRKLVGSRPMRKVGTVFWGVAFVLLLPFCLSFVVPPIWIHLRWRYRLLAEGLRVPSVWPFGFAGLALACATLLLGFRTRDFVEYAALSLPSACFAILAGDAWLTLLLARWRYGQRMAPPPSHRVQFSLGTLLLLTLLAGGWISGLVAIFGP
ncbi:MAG: hypothetical protein M5U26_29420 [Planctomycetota bacterium]|nr:hypothetical protein [Planctomycetota bacterium]